MIITINQSEIKREYCGDIDLKIGLNKSIPLTLEDFLELKMKINRFKYSPTKTTTDNRVFNANMKSKDWEYPDDWDSPKEQITTSSTTIKEKLK